MNTTNHSSVAPNCLRVRQELRTSEIFTPFFLIVQTYCYHNSAVIWLVCNNIEIVLTSSQIWILATLETAVNKSLDRSITEIKLASIAKMSSLQYSQVMEDSHAQLNIQESEGTLSEDSISVNVGSTHSQSSIECDNPEVITVTLPDLPQANPVRDRRSSVISFSSSPTGIEAGHNKMVAYCRSRRYQ